LTKLAARNLNLKTQSDIIAAVYRNNFDIASIAPWVFKAAEKSDETCMRIVSHATWELGEHVRALLPKLQPPSRRLIKNKIPVSFIGGLIANPTILSVLLREHIEEELPGVQIIAPMSPPMYGAALMAMTASHHR
jgi:N-acetylglucosamine kinase-like BadF-type ATPase